MTTDGAPGRRRNPRSQADARAQIDKELEEYQQATARGQAVPAPQVVPVVQRVKLGWQIRTDLKKACQQIALDKTMKDYEVLEMLLDEALAARNGKGAK